MFPIIGRWGPFTLYTFTLLIDLGLVALVAWLYRQAPREQRARWLDAAWLINVGGFLGARLLYAAVNSAYYALHPWEIFQIWLGGLSWPGAVVGGLLALWWYCRHTGIPWQPLLEALALPIGLMQLMVWSSCLFGGCAYGYTVRPGDLPTWLTLTATDIYGTTTPRFATQTVGILWSVLCLAMVIWLLPRFRLPHGASGLMTIGLTAAGALLLSFTRGDPMPLVYGWRLDIPGNALIVIGAVGATCALRSFSPRPSVPPTESRSITNL